MSTRSTIIAVLSVSAFSLLSALAPAQIIRVPSQQATIQGALNAATSGTLVLVAPGTYKELINWPSTDGIELRSEQGAATTIIDGTQSFSLPITRP